MKKNIRFAMMILTAVLLLSACIPTTTGSEGTTIDATQAAQMVEDAVEQALNAQATENAAKEPAATATQVPPTNTAIPAPPTETPVPTVTAIVLAPTATVVPASGGGTTYQTPEYYCTYNEDKKPKDNELFAPGDSFDIKFTLVNAGTATWPAGTDVKYGYNTDLTNGGVSRTELAVDVGPGESVIVGPFDAWAPNKSGHYVMGFIVEGVDNCIPYVAINVK